jgi:hypothetical protein
MLTLWRDRLVSRLYHTRGAQRDFHFESEEMVLEAAKHAHSETMRLELDAIPLECKITTTKRTINNCCLTVAILGGVGPKDAPVVHIGSVNLE